MVQNVSPPAREQIFIGKLGQVQLEVVKTLA